MIRRVPPALALAACLQVDAVCHNAFIQEQSLGIHYNQADADLLTYLTNPGVLAVERGGDLRVESFG